MARQGERTNYRVTFAVLLVGVSAYSLLQSLVLPALPTIQHKLHTSQDTVTWVLTAYLLSASVATPILGRVGDMIGKKKVFVFTLGALAVGSLLGALAPSIGVMIMARVIQGIGGGVLPLAFGIIRDEFPRDKLSAAVGVTAALTAVGAGFGIVLGGPIVDTLNYHWLFWIPMFMVLVALVGVQVLVPESAKRTPGRINWLAAILLSGWLVALLVAVSEGPTWGWMSSKVVGMFGLAIVLAVGWVLVELRAAEPLIDMRMMRIPAVWTTNLVALLFGVGLYASFAFLPGFVQTAPSAGYGFAASITKSGLFLLPLAVLMFVSGMLSARLAERFGGKAVLFIGSTISVPPFVMLALAHNHQWEVFVATGILGAGFGLAFSAMSTIIVQAVPSEQTAVASGMNANIRTIGGAMGAGIMASVVTSGVAAGALPKESGYSYGFGMLGVAAGLAAVAAIFVPSARRLAAARSAVDPDVDPGGFPAEVGSHGGAGAAGDILPS
jgi:EmrB/QacA subfamily drug resistance transporter